ncbi:hypothetical protein D3C87_1802600 [compost metagenome]
MQRVYWFLIRLLFLMLNQDITIGLPVSGIECQFLVNQVLVQEMTALWVQMVRQVQQELLVYLAKSKCTSIM